MVSAGALQQVHMEICNQNAGIRKYIDILNCIKLNIKWNRTYLFYLEYLCIL